MIDPITLSAAVSTASAAYSAVKKMITAGKEIEDISETLGRWMTSVSDIDNINKSAQNASSLTRMLNGSVEEVALKSYAAKKKIEAQREELKNYLIGNYGLQAWNDLIKEEGRIRRKRAELIYQAEERRQAMIEYTIMGIASFIGLAAVGWMVWIISMSMAGK
tara:strand:+ start:174 stop:662 length:489 start_codon:yes stop_codon:yes gene_type:complete